MLDHYLTLYSGEVIYVSMRIIADGEGGVEVVAAGPARLKRLLER